jgi:hypothetical protein
MATSSKRAKSDIAREAIAVYLDRHEKGRFLAEIARAARSSEPGGEDPIDVVEEAVPFDNEAFLLSEHRSIQESLPRYRHAQRRRPKRR